MIIIFCCKLKKKKATVKLISQFVSNLSVQICFHDAALPVDTEADKQTSRHNDSNQRQLQPLLCSPHLGFDLSNSSAPYPFHS